MRLVKLLKKWKISKTEKEKYWMDESKKLHWFREPTSILPSEENKQKWFENGLTNMAYNCLEVHVQNKNLCDSPAIFYGNLTTEKQGFVTYKQLRKRVFEKVGVLRNLGIKKNDRILIYMPNVIDAVEVVLACSVIGAVFEFQNYGLGVISITKNLLEFNPNLIVTSSCSVEEDGISQNKFFLDLARKKINREDIKCLVLQREEKKVFDLKSNDLRYDDFIEKNMTYDYEILNSNDNLYVFNSYSQTQSLAQNQCKIETKKLFRETGPFMVGLKNSMENVMGISHYDIMMNLCNLSSTIGLSYSIFGPLLCGGSSFIIEDFFAFKNKSEEIILQNKIKTMFIHNNLLNDVLEHNKDFLKNSDLEILYINGKISNSDFQKKIYNDCKKKNIFCSQAYYLNEMGFLLACDNLRHPLKNNEEMKIFPAANIEIIQTPLEHDKEFNLLTIEYSSFPGIFRTALSEAKPIIEDKESSVNDLKTDTNDLSNYFDENNNLKIFTRGKINEDNSLCLQTRNFVDSPYSLLSGMKVLKSTIIDLIEKHPLVEDVFLFQPCDDDLILVISLIKKNFSELNKTEKDNLLNEIKKNVKENLGEIVVFDKILVFDNLPKIDSDGKKVLDKKQIINIIQKYEENDKVEEKTGNQFYELYNSLKKKFK